MILCDILLHGGKEYPLPVELLEVFFAKYPAKRPAGKGRSYQAVYRFEEEELRVHDLLVPDARNLRTGLRSILNENIEPEDRGITHFSGLILLHPAYKNGQPVPFNGKGSYTLLEVRRGRLRAEKSFEAARLDQFKKDQFAYFQITDDYETLKAEAKLAFEKAEQEARRREPGRGYKPFDEAAFNQQILQGILEYSKELLAD